MIGYHGTAETGSGFGTSTVWQDVDYLSADGFQGMHVSANTRSSRRSTWP